jgi:hypothetical protein
MGIQSGFTSSWTKNPSEKWDSVENYQLMDKESIGEMGFRWELPAHGQGSHWRNGIPSGISSLWMLIQTGSV